MTGQLQLVVQAVPALVDFGTRSGWGEGWWVSADLALTHPHNSPELPPPLDALVAAFDRRLDDAFINGTGRQA